MEPFIVPFGEWEKNPRLQAKTLVGLRCHGKLPQDLTFRLRSEVPSGLDHQVPQAGYLWRRGHSLTELLREICKSLDIEIIKGHVSKDHVHLFVLVRRNCQSAR